MHKLAQITLRLLALIISATLTTYRASAQLEQWYTSDGHLSSSLINDVLYDSSGMIWITTEDCLNRFDGSKFTIYHNDPSDPHSIGNDHVNSTFEDAQGRIFVCSHAGVQLYHPDTDSFSEPLNVIGHSPQGIPLSDMVQRKNGELWVVGNEVFRIIDTPDGTLALEPIDLPDEIRSISKGIADDDDNIWLAKGINGLYRISPQGDVRHYFCDEDAHHVTSIALDSDNNLYAGTARHGLFRYDKDKDSFSSIDLSPIYEGHIIFNIFPDEFGNLLIGTDGGGLIWYNPSLGRVSQFNFSNIDSDKLKVHGITKDSFGNLWVGVYQKGLLKVAPSSGFFRSIDERTSDLIGTCCVTAIRRDQDGTLWVGTDNDDVFAVDMRARTSRHYTIDIPNSIMGMFIDSKGRLYVGSYNRGMGMIDRHNGHYTPIKLSHDNNDVRHIFDFAELPDGQLLIATMGDGLYRYNPDTHTSERIDIDGINQWINAVEISPETGDIMLGTYDGLFIVSPDMQSVKHLLPSYIVSAMHFEPKHHDTWLGTNQGLVRIHGQYEVDRIYGTEDGLPSQAIYAIEHGDDALWLSTNNGLSKFVVKDGTFYNFNVNNGLPNNEFYRNSSHKDSDGNIYFGGINGIASFKSSNVRLPDIKLSLRVTDFIVGDKSINASSLSGNRQIIDVPVTEAKVFRLSHEDNSFSVVINNKEFVNTALTDFYYSFDGSDWTRIAGSNNAMGVPLTFTNVSSGVHTLKIKAVYAGTETDELSLTIDIDTVWYATWWAKVIYAMLFMAILYVVYLQIRHRIRVRRDQEERKHKAEILESKLQFFTNISHEIRTPLSLVIGPLQKLQDTDTDKDRSTAYRVIMRNANRILRLVNELMDLRKIDNKQMKLHFSHVNICTFVNDVYETFRPAASIKGIDLTYTHPGCDDLEGWVDQSNFDKIIMNLMSNAMKFTPEGGKININLSHDSDSSIQGPLSDYIEIAVTDSGIGIPEKDRKSIFNRFFQGTNNKVGGTGIGLHLTSQLTELHYGTIHIEDNPDGQGSRFVVRIPFGSDHLSPDQIVHADTKPKPKTEDNVLMHSAAVDLVSEESDKPKAPRSKDTVFIVEDDEEIRSYLDINLGKYFKTKTFSNGKLALEAMYNECPALVITDVMMPEMDGYTLTKKIKQNINLNRTPVIILTAKTREEDNLDAISSGAAVYITKPFNIDVVIRTAQNMVESVARLRNAFSGSQTQEDKLEEIPATSNDEKLMERVMKVINKNLSNSDITVEMIAREIGISRVHLHRKLKELTNQSTRDFIRNIRLQAAAKLLKEKKLTVAEVSDLVGFKQPNNFSTAFRDMFGISPTAYSAKYHDTDQEQPQV